MMYYWFGGLYQPVDMLARLDATPWLFIGKSALDPPFVPVYTIPFGGSQLEFTSTLPKLAANFPYGYAVEPDHP